MNPSPSYVSWAAVLAGAAVATAISVVMLQFGSAVGLAAIDDITPETVIRPWGIFAVAFWLLWVQLLASVLGGYLAGRMRHTVPDATPQESEIRDGAHGLLVWATGTIVVAAAAAVAGAFAALVPDTQEPVVAMTPAMMDNEKAMQIIYAFAAGATSLVSAVATWFAATKGGDHRDNNVDSSDLSFRIR